MPLGTEVVLGPADIVLDGDPAPHTERGTATPHFSAHVYCGQTVAISLLLLRYSFAQFEVSVRRSLQCLPAG